MLLNTNATAKPRAVARVNARLWSKTVSMKPIARQLGGRAAVVYDAGDSVRLAVGAKLAHHSSEENYLTTPEVRAASLGTTGDEVAKLLTLLEGNLLITTTIEMFLLDAVVWVVVAGEAGAARFEDLRIDTRPFGSTFGLVVENQTDVGPNGSPKRLLIGSAAFQACRDE